MKQVRLCVRSYFQKQIVVVSLVLLKQNEEIVPIRMDSRVSTINRVKFT